MSVGPPPGMLVTLCGTDLSLAASTCCPSGVPASLIEGARRGGGGRDRGAGRHQVTSPEGGRAVSQLINAGEGCGEGRREGYSRGAPAVVYRGCCETE